MLILWFILLHVLSAINFFLAHGAAAAMVYKVRTETDVARIRAMLDLAISTFPVYMASFTIMGLTGLVLPFLFHFWSKSWVWLSIAMLLFVVVWMGGQRETIQAPAQTGWTPLHAAE